MPRIGKYDVVLTETLLIPLEEADAWVRAAHGDDPIVIRIKFAEDHSSEKADRKGKGKGAPRVRVEGAGDHAVVTLINWSETVFAATTTPLRIGKTDAGRDIFIMLDCYVRKPTARLTVQIMLGGAK